MKTPEDLVKNLDKEKDKDTCYFCDSPDTVEVLRVMESPKDKNGIPVPVCEKCYHQAQKYL